MDSLKHMVGYAASGRIPVGVQLRAYPEPGLGGGGRDEVDHHFMADEWFATPVLADGRRAIVAVYWIATEPLTVLTNSSASPVPIVPTT